MYVKQAFKGQLGFWKYLPIPLAFFGMMVLSFAVIKIMNMDVTAFMQAAVAEKGSTNFLLENLIQFALGLFMLLAWVKWVHRQSIVSLTTSRPAIDWSRVLHSFCIWGSLVVGTTLLGFYISPENYEINFQWGPFLNLAVVAILLIPLQTSFEEYLFRGYMMQGLGAYFKSNAIPFFTTSILFGLMHIGNPEVETLGYGILVYYIGTGFFLGALTLLDEGLELALGFHAANNLVAALLITSNWTAFQTDSILLDIAEPTFDYTIFLSLLLFYPLLLFYFSRKYHWRDIKLRLFGKVTV
ncbi:MAG: CPBP family intramembrane metalloprotease [Flavobacteriia bacterium]|nr:CPBP family intramembrane metalloprotease [Flavobacteriia bacterium]